jgi:hypothetical protein
MNTMLKKSICDRYPLIFAQPDVIECGDGWFSLIEVLCYQLHFWINENGAPQVVAEQVKSKFGRLSFLYRGGNDVTSGMIYMSEAMSPRICEVCGKPGKTEAAPNRWLRTRCPEHVQTIA